MRTIIGSLIITLAMLCGAQAQTAVTVSMTDYAFTPSTLTLKAGQIYRIHFTNGSGKGHDFSAREFFAASTMAPEEKAKLEDGDEVELDSGQSADITLTPKRAGTFPVTCTHFMHAMLGMTGTIVVQ